jgi:hypothetical protein
MNFSISWSIQIKQNYEEIFLKLLNLGVIPGKSLRMNFMRNYA